MKYVKYIDTVLGVICIEAEDDAITKLSFVRETQASVSCPLLDEAEQQLREYLAGERKTFDLPLDPRGTPFQQKVWAALQEIPWGETRTYGDIARQVGRPGGARAVGMANNRNPISIIIPCHRVIGADGKLVGYGGGLDKKAFLLRLEGHIPD